MSSAEDLREAGTPLTVTGRRRCAVRADHRVVSVESGDVNLFVELTDAEGRPRGTRRLAAWLPEGALVALPGVDFDGMRLNLVGVGVAEIRLYEAGDLDAVMADPSAASHRLEVGFGAVLDRLREQERAPSSAYVLRPGEATGLPAGGMVSASRPVWVEMQGEADQGAACIHLLGPGRSRTLETAGAVTAWSSAQAVQRYGWALLGRWMTDAMISVAQLLREEEEGRARRLQRRRQDDAEQVATALDRLPAIVNNEEGEPVGRVPDRARSPVAGAVAAVCAAQRIGFEAAHSPADEQDPQQELQDLLRRSNLRFRRIALDGTWWRRDGLDAVGFRAETGKPVAILRTGPGRFDCVDTTMGESRPIDRKVAESLADFGFVIYKPLPFRPLKAIDMVRHVLSGHARFDMRWAVVLAVAAALLALLPPFLTGILFNEVVPFSETRSLIHLAVGLAFVALGSATFQLVRSIALLRVETYADGGLQAAVWDRLLRLPLTFFRRYAVGDLLIKAMGPTQLRQAISDTALTSVLSGIFSVINFGLMLSYDGTLAVAALIFTLVTSLVLLALSRLQLRFERVQLTADAAVSSFIIQILQGIQKIRLMGAEDRAFARWLHRFSDQRQHTVRAARLGNAIETLSAVLPLLASILFFYLVGTAEEGRLSVGSFVAFNAAFGVFHGALLGLVGAVSASLSAVPIYENMMPLLAEQPELDPSRKPAPPFAGDIQMSKVSFRYESDGPPILDGVDLHIGAGQFVAFVGPSGSGKSTIFRLLLGFETPEHGTVSYDGVDLNRLDLKTVRRQMGVVLQRGAILPGSIFDNIVGSAPLTQDDAWEAVRMAGFAEDVERMPMGMYTVLTEGGTTLSGGQRQRLMIARAVVRKPRILLMDEATSALDNRTQAIVSESLAHLNATRVVIAHRLSTVIHADRIFVVVGGRIVQSGTYDDLMQVDGPFRELARRQVT